MKIVYFDCFDCVSANLLLSAFIDLGTSEEYIKEKMSDYDFEIICTKSKDDIIEAVKADILVEDDRIIDVQDALKMAQNICDDTERCLMLMALKKLKKVSVSQFLKIRACIISYLATDADYAVSSYLLEGKNDSNIDLKICDEAFEIIVKENIPYKISDESERRIFADGVSVISALSKEYGPMPDVDIIKIAYGTDGKRYLRIVLGTPKNKRASDFFEMSLDFTKDCVGVFACEENK